MNDALKMFLMLTGMAAICGGLLAGVRQLTSEAIANQELRHVLGPAIRTVLSGADNDPVADKKEVPVDDTVITLFQQKNSNAVTAVALTTQAMGYGGAMSVVTAFDAGTGACKAIAVATASETPGIGSKVFSPGHCRHFSGLLLDNEARLKKDGGSIDAVSGATISSRALCSAVAAAQRLYSRIHAQQAGK